MGTVRKLGLVAAGCCAVSALTVPPAYAGSGFAGSWTAIDGDGSNLSLSIRGSGPRYTFREVDDSAHVCDGAPATINGAGRADGEVLEAQATLACMPGGNIFRQRFDFVFFYDAGTDTLTDGDDVVYTRAG